MGDFQGRSNASSAALLPAERPRRRTGTIGAALRQALLGCALLAAGLSLAPRAAMANPVTDWTVLADRIGGGSANWHTLAIMHRAMHDAFNAALPIYARWDPPAPEEPSGAGSLPCFIPPPAPTLTACYRRRSIASRPVQRAMRVSHSAAPSAPLRSPAARTTAMSAGFAL